MLGLDFFVALRYCCVVSRSDLEVIHPNSKGGYSTVFQRNKAVRTKEMEREAMAQQWIRKNRS